MKSLVGTTLGQYRIVEQIGSGGMATVFKAFQPALDRYVAVKVLPAQHALTPGFSERFTREAKAVAQLNHPNILPIYDFGQEGDLSYIVMKYVPAGTLKDRLGQPLNLEATRLIEQIAGALDHAHGRGILHRDVKPSNVLLDEGDWVLLTDFGLARMIAGETHLTATGVGIGTPAYMSPEQGKGEKVDQRTDIYSLGVILYEMATGRVPYEAETPLAVVLKHVQGDLSLPRSINPDIPETVEQVILKAMAKQPEDRYDSAGEMAEALKRALEAPVAPAVPVAPPKPEAVPAVEVVKPGAIVEEAKRPIPWLLLVVGGGVSLLLMVAVVLLAALLGPLMLRPRATPVPTRMALPSVVTTAEPTATPVPSPTAPSAALATSTKAPTPTPTPMAKATAIPQPTATSEGGIIAPEPRPNGPLVFEDDFSGGANGAQPLFKDEWMAFDYVDGKGRLTSSYKGAVMPAMYPALELADFYAEFDFQAPAAAPYSGYGFIFRSDDTEGGSLDWYYMLRIRPVEGTISLHGWLDPDWVVHEDFTLPLGLLDPAGFNRVRLEARGGEFRVFVNGAFIFEFTDTTLVDPGIFGFLIVPSEEMEEGEEDFVYFDNLRIYALSEAISPVRPTPPHVVLLYSDDFSDLDSGWGTKADEKRETYYANGEYVILVKGENWAGWTWGSGDTFSDFTLEADARLVEGPESARFGLIFRHEDNDNFYYFYINGQGKYRVGKQQDEEWQSVGDVKWTPSPHIKTEGATNHLKVVGFGAKFSFYVNGRHLTTVRDDAFDEGKVGLIAETVEGSNPIKVAFDNLRVYGPSK